MLRMIASKLTYDFDYCFPYSEQVKVWKESVLGFKIRVPPDFGRQVFQKFPETIFFIEKLFEWTTCMSRRHLKKQKFKIQFVNIEELKEKNVIG